MARQNTVAPKKLTKASAPSSKATDVSRRLEAFVAQPHLTYELEPSEIPDYLEATNELLTRVTELRDNLARRVPSTTRILGRPMREIRAVLRLDSGEGFDFDAARQRVQGDAYAVRRVLADLVTDGWVVQDGQDHWVATAKAKELQFESRGRLSRVRADGLLNEFLRRVDVANDDPKLAFKVNCVVVFGSYLSGRDRIGDVDVAVGLRPRLQSHAAQEALNDEARARGPHARNIVDSICWPETEVRRFLKARSPWLDVRALSEIEELFRQKGPLPHEVLFGYWIPPSRKTAAP